MPSTSWSDAEDLALQGLPVLAQVLYLRALKRWMDYSTGLVGLGRGVSWQSVGEALEVVPRQGFAGVRHTKGQLRRALGWLERAGLVEDRTEGARLVFYLPLAGGGESARKKPVPMSVPLAEGTSRTPGLAIINENIGLGSSQDKARTTSETKPVPKFSTPLNKKDQEQDQEQKHVKLTASAAQLDESVAVFADWQGVMEKPRAKPSKERMAAIRGRLREGFSSEELMLATRGCRASPWHQGHNPQAVRYDDIALICRDARQVERFAEIGRRCTESAEALDEWLADEGRGRVITGECGYG